MHACAVCDDPVEESCLHVTDDPVCDVLLADAAGSSLAKGAVRVDIRPARIAIDDAGAEIAGLAPVQSERAVFESGVAMTIAKLCGVKSCSERVSEGATAFNGLL